MCWVLSLVFIGLAARFGLVASRSAPIDGLVGGERVPYRNFVNGEYFCGLKVDYGGKRLVDDAWRDRPRRYWGGVGLSGCSLVTSTPPLEKSGKPTGAVS